eukprot:jgi/Mesvir1/3221/Mv16370-RA.1
MLKADSVGYVTTPQYMASAAATQPRPASAANPGQKRRPYKPEMRKRSHSGSETLSGQENGSKGHATAATASMLATPGDFSEVTTSTTMRANRGHAPTPELSVPPVALLSHAGVLATVHSSTVAVTGTSGQPQAAPPRATGASPSPSPGAQGPGKDTPPYPKSQELEPGEVARKSSPQKRRPPSARLPGWVDPLLRHLYEKMQPDPSRDVQRNNLLDQLDYLASQLPQTGPHGRGACVAAYGSFAMGLHTDSFDSDMDISLEVSRS